MNGSCGSWSSGHGRLGHVGDLDDLDGLDDLTEFDDGASGGLARKPAVIESPMAMTTLISSGLLRMQSVSPTQPFPDPRSIDSLTSHHSSHRGTMRYAEGAGILTHHVRTLAVVAV